MRTFKASETNTEALNAPIDSTETEKQNEQMKTTQKPNTGLTIKLLPLVSRNTAPWSFKDHP